MSEETGHWYSRDGAPMYQVNGRGTTLRDARRLDLVPSVTTVLSVLHKDALVKWKEEQVAQRAWERAGYCNGVEPLDRPEYVAQILAAARQRPVDAANEGTRIHDACEQYVKSGGLCPEPYRLHAEAAVAELRRLFPDVNDWVAEQSFGHPLGFGGKVDLHSPSTGIVCDYKTKDGDFSDGKKLAWDQHYQLAAYQVGLLLADKHAVFPTPFKQCANIFVSRTHPGKVASHVWTADEIAQGWRIFECALNLWREMKGYDPRF